MSDTPETDLWLKQQIVCNYEHEMVSAGFARTLERERNKERKVSEKRRTLLIYFMEAVDKLEDECDKARKWAKRWKERAYYYRIDCSGTLAERDNLLRVVQVRRRERDEAREKAERYRIEANAMMAKLHELQTYADKLADGLPAGMLPRDVENLREANAGLAEDLQNAERERDEARHLLERKWQGEDPPLIKMMQERDEARRLLASAKESLNAIHVEVGGWIAAMMKEGK